MDFTQATIESAYNAINKQSLVGATSGIVSVFALIVMTFKIIDIWRKNQKEQKDTTITFMDVARKYALYYLFIITFPFFVPTVEGLFAQMQDSLNSQYGNTSLSATMEQAIKNQVDNYLQEEKAKDGAISQILDDINPFTEIKAWLAMATISFYTCALAILKYMYFFFVAGRYLWLAMLQIVAPVAMVLSLWEKTLSITIAFFKNLFVCYLLVPCYLLANVFSEEIIKALMDGSDFNAYGVFGVIGMMILKFSMFSIVTKKSMQLL